MTKFADQLYTDLMREHGSTLADTALPAGSRRQIASRPVLLAAGAGGLAVAAAIGTLAAGGGTPAARGGSPAYALTASPDGTIKLAVYRASGIAQVNTRLRQLGDSVVVVPVEAGCPSFGSLPAPPVRPSGPVSLQGSASGDGSVTVNASGVPAGDIMVVAVETSGQSIMTEAGLTSPPAPACVSLPAQPGVPAGSGGARWSGGSGASAAHRSPSG